MPVKLENYTRAMTSDPQWLTREEIREEIRAWLTLAGLVESLPTVLSAQLKQDAGINNFDYMVLSCMSDTPHQTVRKSDLAAFVGGSISRLSHTLTKMENRGWVRRRPDTDNGRFTEVALTQEGKDVVAQAAPRARPRSQARHDRRPRTLADAATRHAPRSGSRCGQPRCPTRLR